MTTVISIASGKGGVGKSITATNLALQFAKTGKRVVLVDLDVGGANLHILFGVLTPTTTLTDFLERKTEILGSTVHHIPWAENLGFIPGTTDTLTAGNLLHSKKHRLLRHLRSLNADIVILDCAPGTHYHTLDFFLFADIQLTVTTPDPTAVIEVYRFIKMACLRQLLTKLSIHLDGETRQTLVNQEFSTVEEVLETFDSMDKSCRGEAQEILRNFQPYLMVNRVSNKSKFSTSSLQQVLLKFLGTNLVVLGEIPQDESVEQSVRNYLPVTDWAPESLASQSMKQAFYALEQRVQHQRHVSDTPVLAQVS